MTGGRETWDQIWSSPCLAAATSVPRFPPSPPPCPPTPVPSTLTMWACCPTSPHMLVTRKGLAPCNAPTTQITLVRDPGEMPGR